MIHQFNNWTQNQIFLKSLNVIDEQMIFMQLNATMTSQQLEKC